MAKKKPKRPAAAPAAPTYTPEQIRAVRERNGLDVEGAAKMVGVQPRTWLSWELPSQQRTPSLSHRLLIKLLLDKEK